jgi:hypothetical protein
MADTGILGGVIALGIGVVVADRILDNRRKNKRKKRSFSNWVERETTF